MRLRFRPPAAGPADALPVEPYDGPLGLAPDTGRDGVLYVPETAERGAPVLLFFHGAGGTGRRELRAIVAAADERGVVVVAPDSRGPTWDVLCGGFGPDVEFADRALAHAAARVGADFNRIAIGGISDGASYALSIGLCNGDLFSTVLAYSAGFVVPPEPVGMPRVFLSHGTRDQILPIDGCGRAIAHGLDDAGYDVAFAEFDGGHTVPPVVAERGITWWLDGA